MPIHQFESPTVNDTQRSELLQLLSAIMRRIHQLSSRQARTIMDIDDRMRRDMLRVEDLDVLRSIDETP